jgi:mono/diheme cytochrome c family protein
MRFCLALICGFVAFGSATADDRVDYSRDIRPILAQHCWSCHGVDEKARESGLRLDDRDSALAKKAIVPKDAKASKLIARIESKDPDRQMPPPEAKKPLSERQKQQLRAWIEQGAEYTRHWAFVTPKRPTVPNVEGAQNPIDTFVRERLLREKLAPSPEADRTTLLRRVSLDLTGLPPSLDELDSFLADRSPNAYEKVVDRLLASPRYAERMAMIWLDAARYADTNGFNNDEDRTQWPWRDWLIGAFARNLPYDRFVIEQLAGDLLPGATIDQKVATAFLRNQVHNTEGGIIPEEYRIEYVADRVHTTATVFLGMSMQCARCHDHKYDPITQREYYQFFGFFQNIADRQASYSNFVGAEPYIRVPSTDQRDRLAKLDAERAELEKQIRDREASADAAVLAWERALTDADRERIRGAGILLGVSLDESKGATVATSDNAVKGTVRGNAKWTAGKTGGAFDFDGQSFIEIAAGPKFDGNAFSVSAWVYPATNDLLAIASRMDDGAAHRGWDMLLENGKVSTHLVHHWPDNGLKVVTKKAITSNAWHHILMTYDGKRKGAGVRIYVDGKLEPTDVTNDKLRDTIRTDKPLHIGRRGASLPFKGKIDDLRIYGLELSAENAGYLASGKSPDLIGSLLAIAADKRTPAQQSAIRRFYLENIDGDHGRLKAALAETTQQRSQIEKALPALMVMEEMPTPRDIFVLKRGQYDRPGDKVTVGVPAVFPSLQSAAKTPNRLDLAKWLVSAEHPLSARVAVNRWWEMYFGVGLVKTVEDFGTTGDYPSHPDLLDWLATELVRTGWDIKAMQKLIVTSATYQQSSAMTKASLERDPENRLLARGPRHRLSAESVRDNALAISGLLVERLGGPSVKPYQPAGLWEDVTVERRGKYVADQGESLYRRGMYTFWKRTCPPPGLMTFDAPNREVCVARRSTTNTPLQALVLLNDPTYIEAARKLAEQMLRGGTTVESQLTIGFRRAIGRTPSDEEARLLLKIHAGALARFQADNAAARELLKIGNAPADASLNETDLAAWTIVASTILNLDETITKR